MNAIHGYAVLQIALLRGNFVKHLVLAAVFILVSATASLGQENLLLDKDWVSNAAAAEYEAAVRSASDLNARDSHGMTPLHYAARYGTPAGVVALLERGAEVNARDERGETPLHSAASGRNPANIVTLLEAGADGSARANYGKTPFDLVEKIEELRGTDAYRKLNDAQDE